jgi:prevent-host-death family protein
MREHRPQKVALAKVRDDLSRYLRLAENGEIVITRHGRPAGVLIGFPSEEAWIEYRLGHHSAFLRRVAEARTALAAGQGIRLEDVKD